MPSGKYDATEYTYTVAGQLASVTDPGRQTWTYGYDLRGNKVRVDDPDKGPSTMEYDAADQLVATTDARGVKLTVAHDLLGRRTSVKRGRHGARRVDLRHRDQGQGGNSPQPSATWTAPSTPARSMGTRRSTGPPI
jgi:YD repeat-containing protein